jgi:anti-sigma factor RsiW
MSHRHALACDECRSLLGGYVLDALEPDEMDAVRAHVADCTQCAREHAELAPIPALLDAAGSADESPARPPARLEDAVLDNFARERPRREPEPERRRREPGRARRWFTRPVPIAATAAAAAALVTIALTTGLQGSGPTSARAYSASLRGSALAPGAVAYARLTTRPEGTRVDLRVRGMSFVPGAVYELWCIDRNGGKVTAGTFRVDSSGRASVRLTTAARLGEYDRLSVERLVPSGQGGRVLAGSVEY